MNSVDRIAKAKAAFELLKTCEFSITLWTKYKGKDVIAGMALRPYVCNITDNDYFQLSRVDGDYMYYKLKDISKIEGYYIPVTKVKQCDSFPDGKIYGGVHFITNISSDAKFNAHFGMFGKIPDDIRFPLSGTFRLYPHDDGTGSASINTETSAIPEYSIDELFD